MELDYLKASDETGAAVLMNIQTDRSIGATTLDVDSVDNLPDKFILVTGSADANGYIDSSTITEMTCHLNGADIEIDGFEPGYTDQGNTAGQIAVVKPTTGWADRVANTLQDIATGWLPAIEPGESWTYASATTITVPSDATTKYSPGMFIKLSQPTDGTKYFVIIHVDTTTLTIAGIDGDDLDNEAINTPYYSMDATPQGVEHGLVPSGIINPYGGSSAPAGFLLCDGSAVSRTTYAKLFAAIGTSYGSGDGSTTFELPDLQQRFPLGKAASGTGSTLGGSGGAIDHDHNFVSPIGYVSQTAYGIDAGDYNDELIANNQARSKDIKVIDTVDTTTSGRTGNTEVWTIDTTTNNPPFQVVNYIIKT